MADLPSISRAAKPPAVPIPQVQGISTVSPLLGASVTVSGVVTGIQRTGKHPGFFLQDPTGDSNVATSDGIYVRIEPEETAWQERVRIGQRASASGIVSERGGMTSIDVARSSGVTAHRSERVTIAPERIILPVDEAARTGYLEAREGMLLTLPQALVVGPSNPFGQYVVVDEQLHGPRRMEQPDRTGPIHANGRLGPRAQLSVGDRVTNLRGPLGMTNGRFELLPVGNYELLRRGPQPPHAYGDLDGDDQFTTRDGAALAARIGQPATGPLDPADLDADGRISQADAHALDQRMRRDTGAPVLRIASMNAQNFFDDDDAPAPIDDDVLSSNEYQTKLTKVAGTIRDVLRMPDLLAMQEVENQRVVDDLLARPELAGLGYRSVLLPTSGARSINPVLLYRGDDITVTAARQLQRSGAVGEQPLPRDVAAGAQAAQSALFAREPLIVDLRVGAGEQARDITVIVAHLVSKFQPFTPPADGVRVAQAGAIREEVDRIRAADPSREVVVLGDMNDTPQSPAMQALLGTPGTPSLINTSADMVPRAEQYSFNYDGRSELVDHIAVTPGLASSVARAGVRHGNTDSPANDAWDPSPTRATDHDLPYLHLRLSLDR